MSEDRCTATTQEGRPCRNAAMPGTELCPTHAGAPVGRPSKLDDRTAERILSILRAGGYAETAAQAAGIGKRTFQRWMERGHQDGADPDEEPYRRFRAAVEEARAIGESRNVALIAHAATENWQAAAWMLERQFPERWARVSQRDKENEGPKANDPFAEVDELARVRNRRG